MDGQSVVVVERVSVDVAVIYGGFGAPIYYDYGANVIVGDEVYVDGQDWGPREGYVQEATQLANPPVAPAEPVPSPLVGQPSEWQPFGVFALTQQEKGTRSCFCSSP